jgi:hypothetical protein
MAKTKLAREMREYLAKIGARGGRKGGRVRASRMTAEQRSDSARKAVQARWAKKKGDIIGVKVRKGAVASP